MPSDDSESIARARLANVDSQLAALEDNISRLKVSLRHWQTWEIDYEGLREEFARLSDDCTDEEVRTAARDFNAEALDEKEIESLIKSCHPAKGRRSQLIDRLARRSDYVVRNADTIRRQLKEIQQKRNALLLAENPDFQNDAALPLTEITEELDDHGGVISSSTQTPKDAAPQLSEILQQAGVEGLGVSNGVVKQDLNESKLSLPAQEVNAKASDFETVSKASASTARQNGATLSKIQTPTSKEPSVDMQSESDSASPIIPDNESPEDALLRRQMLEYQPDEVGAVVAQLEIDDDSGDNESDASIHDFMDEEELQIDDSEDSDAFDEIGRSLKSPITEEYRQQMIALEKKLNGGYMRNVGPAPEHLSENAVSTLDKPLSDEASSQDKKTSKTESQKPSKKVSFAKDLDIAMPTADKASNSSIQNYGSTDTNTRPEQIGELAPKSSSVNSRVSKFKVNRSTNTASSQLPSRSTSSPVSDRDIAYEGYANNMIQSDIIVERPSRGPKSAKPPASDEIDESLHRKEIQVEYNRMRNRIIQREGGFTRELDPEEELPLRDETGRKISRFRAARMR